MPDYPVPRVPEGPDRPHLSDKADPRMALRRQIDENLRAAFGAVLDEPCPDHLARLLGQLSTGLTAPDGPGEDGSQAAPP